MQIATVPASDDLPFAGLLLRPSDNLEDVAGPDRRPVEDLFLFVPTTHESPAITNAPATTMAYGAHDQFPVKCGPRSSPYNARNAPMARNVTPAPMRSAPRTPNAT